MPYEREQVGERSSNRLDSKDGKGRVDLPELLWACPVTLPVAEWTAFVAAFATCFNALITSIVSRRLTRSRSASGARETRDSHALSTHLWLRTIEQGRPRRAKTRLPKLLARRGLDSARDGLKRATGSLARAAAAAPTRKGVVVVVVVSLGPLLRSFTFTEVFPRRRLKHADRRLRRTLRHALWRAMRTLRGMLFLSLTSPEINICNRARAGINYMYRKKF